MQRLRVCTILTVRSWEKFKVAYRAQNDRVWVSVLGEVWYQPYVWTVNPMLRFTRKTTTASSHLTQHNNWKQPAPLNCLILNMETVTQVEHSVYDISPETVNPCTFYLILTKFKPTYCGSGYFLDWFVHSLSPPVSTTKSVHDLYVFLFHTRLHNFKVSAIPLFLLLLFPRRSSHIHNS